jgi:hypothetical protein
MRFCVELCGVRQRAQHLCIVIQEDDMKALQCRRVRVWTGAFELTFGSTETQQESVLSRKY